MSESAWAPYRIHKEEHNDWPLAEYKAEEKTNPREREEKATTRNIRDGLVLTHLPTYAAAVLTTTGGDTRLD